MKIQKSSCLKGEINVPGDKSISHRAVMFGAISEGTTRIRGFLEGADCLSTIACFREMGIEIGQHQDEVLVKGKGLRGLAEPRGVLDAGNSGTTTRLISGILAGQTFSTVLTGDDSLRRRPMGRIITPLTAMGARISSENGCLPLSIEGGSLIPIDYQSPVASAQVKSCVLLAGLYAEGKTSVTEPALSRDHTERMLRAFGARVSSEGLTATIEGSPSLTGQDILVPGDISSAAYFLAAGALIPGSEILLRHVGTNPTRDGVLRVLTAMGAKIERLNEHTKGEPYCDLLIRHSPLKATTIGGDLIPTLIDEIPILAICAAAAEGTTVIRDARELRVKESDRIQTMTEGLTALGAKVTPTEDGMIIEGGHPLHGGIVDSHKDHRIAMSFAVAAGLCKGEVDIRDADCVDISYPTFYQDLARLGKG